MTIIFSSAAGLSCAFYVYVLVKFGMEHYHDLLKRRTRPVSSIGC